MNTHVAWYRKKPIDVRAIQWDGQNTLEVNSLIGKPALENHDVGCARYLIIETLEGDMRCRLGDFVLRGPMGECYPVRRDIFFLTYEHVQEEK